MEKQLSLRWIGIALLGFFLIVCGWLFRDAIADWLATELDNPGIVSSAAMLRFQDEADFKNYLQQSEMLGMRFGNEVFFGAEMQLEATNRSDGPAPVSAFSNTSEGSAPPRFSGTNIQVAGIDEPDIVKTDGERLYYSRRQTSLSPFWRGTPLPSVMWEDELILVESSGESIEELNETDIEATTRRIDPGKTITGNTELVRVFPVEAMESLARIEESGTLLIVGDQLIIVQRQQDRSWDQSERLLGFDVGNPDVPIENWRQEIDPRSTIIATRLFEEKIYLVTRQQINPTNPCPIMPFVGGASIGCNQIFRPFDPVEIDVTYTIMRIDPRDGSIETSTTLVGNSGFSVVYMSTDGVYVTYPLARDSFGILRDFFEEETADLLPESLRRRIRQIAGYDISQQSKETELGIVVGQYMRSLSEDEMRRIENEIGNRLPPYIQDRQRELLSTAIVRINLSDLRIQSSGEVPGRLLNQFSLDSYAGHLRVATTSDAGIWMGGESVNDVYILDRNMRQTGAVLNLGLDERIYAVRFWGEKGYVVTFREIDPFYILDLSDPSNPAMTGELKIPGFSSYLHPLPENMVLGVGQQGWRVKLSLFDVSDDHNPVESDTYLLDAGWSEVSQTHHAFLHDARHGIVFLPAGEEGYVFSYAGKALSLQRVVSDIRSERAIYIDDLLYVIGQHGIVVLDEINWEEVARLRLD